MSHALAAWDATGLGDQSDAQPLECTAPSMRCVASVRRSKRVIDTFPLDVDRKGCEHGESDMF